ncbi:MAG TPA: hypothetical protein VE130_00335 [Nitrososphaeraceae archaeon]|nr:hypothetical protein [Nitrososphaeraceae archaeon]
MQNVAPMVMQTNLFFSPKYSSNTVHLGIWPWTTLRLGESQIREEIEFQRTG